MANPTTNYGFVLPTSTDLVTDLPADFDVALQGVDTRLKALQPGTTLGDLAYSSATANTNTRLGIGSTGQVLTVSGGVPAWSAPASSSGPAFLAFRSGTQQSFSQNTWSKVQFNGETFDTDNCFDSTTNYRFTPNKSGYYQFNSTIGISRTGSYAGYGAFYKNGTEVSKIYGNTNMPGTGYNGAGGCLVFMNGSTDYMEVYVYDSDPAARNVVADQQNANFSGVWIRS